MKKLERLRLHEVEQISENDQRTLYGGGSWVTGPDGNQYWYVGEVQILGSQIPDGGWGSVCPACQRFDQVNAKNPLGGVDGEPVTTPFGEFLFNTIPHFFGAGDHINGNETDYVVTLEDGTRIFGTADH